MWNDVTGMGARGCAIFRVWVDVTDGHQVSLAVDVVLSDNVITCDGMKDQIVPWMRKVLDVGGYC